jgi:hypothetical protein
LLLPLRRANRRDDRERQEGHPHRPRPRHHLPWYSTYRVAFDGTYTFRNPSSSSQSVTFTLDFPAAQAIYDNLEVAADGEPLEIRHQKNAVVASTDVLGGESVSFKLSYRSQGLNSWRYVFGEDLTQVRDFSLIMNTNFEEIDFPENTLSPSDKQETPAGWELTWRYNNLLTGYQLGMEMPFPVLLLLPALHHHHHSRHRDPSHELLFPRRLLLLLPPLAGLPGRPLADHVSIHLAFFICAVVSLFLVISYLRLVVGPRFAFVEAGLAQFIYLVLFSYTFFLEGYTGLSITIGSIITLFVVMQATARINWSEKFAGKKSAGTTRSS